MKIREARFYLTCIVMGVRVNLLFSICFIRSSIPSSRYVILTFSVSTTIKNQEFNLGSFNFI
ncbi:hypothetical protein J2S11_004296 [Bacillus horti]|uniref:Uncharacterized protein n=1 Tax=Caldalkalibacillus horti TaxID=77523 RepID=A0ABT9W5J0_9BACI|nr:hypothetical protein [Bacillus horti]